MSRSRIPFNLPALTGLESDYISKALEGINLSGGGKFCMAAEAELELALNSEFVMLTPSGTDALELASLLGRFGPGDEIIMPSFTFSSTANAVCLQGARPVFVDIRDDTMNINEALITDAITERTRAIIPVHYASVPCEMNAIMDIAERHGLVVIEDAAHAICSSYKGRRLGTIGDAGCFSFHDTKTIVAGEAGAISINREQWRERAEILREKGTNRSQFARGEVAKYTWLDLGSSYLPNELTAAFLLAQLERREKVFSARREIFGRYAEGLAILERRGLVRLPEIPAGCDITHHMFYIVLSDEACRKQLIQYLDARDITAVFHYIPLHSSPMGKATCNRTFELPVTDSVSARLLRLPFYTTMEATDQQRVIDAVIEFFNGR